MTRDDDFRRIRFWKPDTASVTSMIRVEREDRNKVTYSENYSVVVVYEGAFDGWYRGREQTIASGSLKLKEPGEVHRDVRVHAPITLQVAAFSAELVSAASDAMGLRGTPHFRATAFAPDTRASALAFAMHDALVREDASEIERASLVAETLGEVLSNDPPVTRAPRAVRRARAFLHDAIAAKITLDDLAKHAGLDKFHLVRAFRAAVGVPPYEYLTHLRISRARELLARGMRAVHVAQAVGFYDESQLHRHFRRIVGLTPGAYAKGLTPSAIARQHRPRQTPPGVAFSRP